MKQQRADGVQELQLHGTTATISISWDYSYHFYFYTLAREGGTIKELN